MVQFYDGTIMQRNVLLLSGQLNEAIVFDFCTSVCHIQDINISMDNIDKTTEIRDKFCRFYCWLHRHIML